MNKLELTTQFATGAGPPESRDSVAEPTRANPRHLHALFLVAERNAFTPSDCYKEVAWLR
jgi:hypothetical protein